jgi:hypothetical protein
MADPVAVAEPPPEAEPEPEPEADPVAVAEPSLPDKVAGPMMHLSIASLSTWKSGSVVEAALTVLEQEPGLHSSWNTVGSPLLHMYKDVGLSPHSDGKTVPQMMPLAGQRHSPGRVIEHLSVPGVGPTMQPLAHFSPRFGMVPWPSQM